MTAATYQRRREACLIAEIKMEGMKAENSARAVYGETPAYSDAHFQEVCGELETRLSELEGRDP